MNPFVQIGEQSGAGPDAEAMPIDPVLESSGTRRPTEESITTAGGLDSIEQLAPMADGSAMKPRATIEATGASKADARVADAMPETRAEKLVVLEEQMALPEASEGVVRHAMWPLSPLVVPPAAEEEDEVEEIVHEESRPQAVRILRKRSGEVVVVEEEDTTRELRRLESTLSTVMKQIKVSIASKMLMFDIGDWSSS